MCKCLKFNIFSLQLSPAPSAFQQSAIQEEGSKEESNTMNVTFSSSFTDNQPICLEKMQRIADENLLQKLSPENECKEIIHCSIYPDNSTFAYLVNGLVSPTNDDKIKVYKHNIIISNCILIII